MNPRDFKSFQADGERKRLQKLRDEAQSQLGRLGMNVPIIGQRPERIRDQFNRILAIGDFIDVRTPGREPYRVMEMVPITVPHPSGDPTMPPLSMMKITLSSTIQFLAEPDRPDSTFVRVMTVEEVSERQAQGQTKQAVEETAQPTAIAGEFVGSAKACGCDPGAGHLCAEHQAAAEAGPTTEPS